MLPQDIMPTLQSLFPTEGIVQVKIRPLGKWTYVGIRAGCPGRVIGRKGSTVRLLRHILEKEFGVADPRITVVRIRKEVTA